MDDSLIVARSAFVGFSTIDEFDLNTMVVQVYITQNGAYTAPLPYVSPKFVAGFTTNDKSRFLSVYIYNPSNPRSLPEDPGLKFRYYVMKRSAAAALKAKGVDLNNYSEVQKYLDGSSSGRSGGPR